MTTAIEQRLFEMQDEVYRQFQVKLIPGINPDRVIGIRIPQLRKLAKALAKEPDIDEFLSALPHRFYDEYNLHGFLISEYQDYDQAIRAIDALLPYVDNWATCDLLRPKAFQKNRSLLRFDVLRWMTSSEPFIIRFGIEMVMTHFLDEDFSPDLAEQIASIRSDEYYVNMMIAWFFATALAKQWESTLPYLEKRKLTQWVHRKTIQKAIESYRITPEQKAYLRTLK